MPYKKKISTSKTSKKTTKKTLLTSFKLTRNNVIIIVVIIIITLALALGLWLRKTEEPTTTTTTTQPPTTTTQPPTTTTQPPTTTTQPPTTTQPDEPAKKGLSGGAIAGIIISVVVVIVIVILFFRSNNYSNYNKNRSTPTADFKDNRHIFKEMSRLGLLKKNRTRIPYSSFEKGTVFTVHTNPLFYSS
jgi:uncharacterized membrane protein